MFTATVIALLLAPFAIAQQGTTQVNTPSGVTECQPTLITWSGTASPFFLTIKASSDPTGADVANLGPQSGNQLTWNTAIQPGSYVFALKDQTGFTANSGPFNVAAGDSGCLSGGASGSAGSGAPASTGGATGASSAAPAGPSTGATGASTGATTPSTTVAPTGVTTGATTGAATTSRASTTGASTTGATSPSKSAGAAQSGAAVANVAVSYAGVLGLALAAIVA